MSMFPEPSEDNRYLTEHVARLRKSLLLHTGRDLICSEADGAGAAKELFDAPFAVMSHDMSDDPIFNYANRAALALFEMDWSEFTSLPSRLCGTGQSTGAGTVASGGCPKGIYR